MEIYNCSKLKILLSILIPIINFGFWKTFQIWSIYWKENQWICWTMWKPFWLVFLIFLFRGVLLSYKTLCFLGTLRTLQLGLAIQFHLSEPTQKSKQIRSCTWSVSHLTMDAEKLSSNTHNMTCQKTRWSEIEWIM